MAAKENGMTTSEYAVCTLGVCTICAVVMQLFPEVLLPRLWEFDPFEIARVRGLWS